MHFQEIFAGRNIVNFEGEIIIDKAVIFPGVEDNL
jgi:hypothetical protein